ncbi:RICIN domain-containing protein, partial [Kitasatospora sp. NPDC047058]|uniref:RICIN domain-containing protein n=1 Tax=Kitasatospora sp. NPDC047058 TaxID=3155620 RepID=UPI0033FB420C
GKADRTTGDSQSDGPATTALAAAVSGSIRRRIAAARNAAAGWADSGRVAMLAPGFLTWLHGIPGTDGVVPYARAAAVAERNSPALQAFRRLPETLRANLWRHLEEPPAPTAGPSAADTVLAPSVRIVRGFFDTYLQFYALHTPRRDCRQLVARLGDAVRRDTWDDRTLERHLTRCPHCARARAELTAVHTWQRPVLLEALLLWTGDDPGPGPEPAATTPAPATAARPAARPPLPVHVLRDAPQQAAPGAARPRPRPSDKTFMIGLLLLGVVTVAAAAAAAPNRPAPAAAAAQPTPPPVPTAAPPSVRPVDPPSTQPSVPPSPTAPPTPAPSSPAPGRSAPAGASTPSPTGPPTGLRLVNLRTGLCVSPGTGEGAGLRLATCTGGDAQRWQFLGGNGDGLYRIRNTAGGRCLDGTTDGGNTVGVVLRECRTDRREQLWTVAPDRNSAGFRLHFAPRVTSSDYGDHLLGPGDIWPGPAKDGSPLVHQPNYYDKDDFLFTAD